ncbi:MAG TPA: hypothetical protein VER83_06735 [Candidatus Nanopelagicales bacterium]|nr:hypothetical protein [Candidatus Nanopelagicales bacterium]
MSLVQTALSRQPNLGRDHPDTIEETDVASVLRRRFTSAVIVMSLGLAACGGTATPAPATPAPATPSASPSPSPTAAPTATPSAAPVAFTSAAYEYGAIFPAGWRPKQATKPWDGEARIDSTGPFTDQVPIPGSILFFVYGAPTDLDLEAYVARSQVQVNAWHDCPTAPDSASDVALDGTPGRLHRATCLGLFAQKLMVVRDGRGLVVNMLAPPGKADEASKLFEQLVAEMTWPA